ncbi:MAG TPA: D-glycero-beta-D-manno-heptose 1-phosphate adenylyltransferase [Ignavibacteriaceae bacterium]|nr:D-glycero-beta-D-manno-heptose 1-phosphate adenylyltransferase [Ignavibacteriaceae bacterium]
MDSIKTRSEIVEIRKKLKKEKKKVVFTNGCFDLIHSGHVDYLTKAKKLGDILIVGINSDASVKRIKGEKRPIIPETERCIILSNLKPVDFVTVFDEDTPQELIKELKPDVLVKGSDWNIDEIVGRDAVEKSGGAVKTIDFISGQSTSKIINSILKLYAGKP